MKIAVASGKGGTGKTTVSIALALAAQGPRRLLDCDVEEPNSALFLKPSEDFEEPVLVPAPVIDAARCTACGRCAAACRFNAIAAMPRGAILFEELCHGCGGCVLACPVGAIAEKARLVGRVTGGKAPGHADLSVITGTVEIGQHLVPPVIRATRRHEAEPLAIIDCPPGNSCSLVAAIRSVDAVLLVTEPTPFGRHDMAALHETVRKMGLPCGVVLNRSDIGDDCIQRYCAESNTPLLLEIPEDRRIAEGGAKGIPALVAAPELLPAFRNLLRRMEDLVAEAKGGRSA